MELGPVLRLMNRFGFIAPTGGRVTLGRVVFSVLTLAPCTLSGVFVMVYHGLQEANFTALMGFWFFGTATSKAIFRRAYFWYKKDELEELIASIEDPFPSTTPEMNEADAEMHVRSAGNIRTFTRIVFAYTMVNAALSLYIYVSRMMEKILYPETKMGLIFDMWWPGDMQRVPDYTFLVLWQMYVDFTYLTIVNAPETLMCSLMMAASERAAMLSRVASTTLSPGPGGEVTAAFRDWVRYHLHYLRIVDGINDSMGLYIFMTYAFSLVNIIIYSFIIMQDVEWGVIIRIGLNLGGLLLRHFVYARSGQTVLTQSLALRSSVLAASQVPQGSMAGGPASCSLQVLHARLAGGAGPEEISGLGFFGVTMEMFTAVLSASFSNLLVVLEFNKAK